MSSRKVLFAIALALQCAAAEAPATPAGGATPTPSDVFVIPFSHLDLYWGGTQEECLSRGNRILTRAIQLAEKYPQFRFLMEDEVFVANFVDAERGTPELESLKKLVKQGRIEISPKWAAIYQNLPRGEALVRNLEYGKRYAREVFGVDPKVAHLGDLPGYTWQYPQMLIKADVPYMVMTRMGPMDRSLVRWKGLDGTTVLTWHAIKGYGWGAGLGLHRDLDEARLTRISTELSSVQATTKGPVYMGWGTDLWAPSEKLMRNLDVMNAKLSPARFHFSTPSNFFKAAVNTPDIPVLSGEIPSSWANILTSMGQIWPPTITAADTLVNAEKFAAINHALGYADYPSAEFDSLWRHALESMDHNNYGQGGEIGDERKVGYARAATLRGGEILRASLRNIAERVQQPFAKSTPIVVFNPLSWTRDDVVNAHVTLFGDIAPADIQDYKKAIKVVDETGASVPFYLRQYSENISRALELVFIARGVPSVGYKTYYVVPAETPEEMTNAIQLGLASAGDAKQPRRPLGNDVLENRFYRVTLDRATSRIEVFDKDLKQTVIKDMEMVGTEDRGGNTLAIEPVTGRVFPFHVVSTDAEENNSVRAVIRIQGDVAGVPVTQRVALYRDLKKVDLESTVDWKPGTFIKLEEVFPNSQPGSQVRYGIPFGSAGTNDVIPGAGPHFSDEVSADVWKPWRQIQDWVFRGNSDWGVTISTDRQLLTITDSAIRVGLLRGTRFNPLNIVRDGKTVLYQQPEAGTYKFRYSITSAQGDWKAARSWQAGMAGSTPLMPVGTENELSKKTLPPTRSFCSFDRDDVVISAIKKAGTGRDVVIRAFEATGESAETRLNYLGTQQSFRSTNLLEEKSGAEQSSWRFRPFDINTVRVTTP